MCHDLQPSLQRQTLSNHLICLPEQLYTPARIDFLRALLLPNEVELPNLPRNLLSGDYEHFGAFNFAEKHILFE